MSYGILLAARIWLVLIAIAGFVMAGSVAVHELGHAAAGIVMGCDVNLVVLYSQGEMPFAGISCASGTADAVVNLSGFLANLLFGIIFYISGHIVLKRTSYVIAGFGLFGSLADFHAMGMPYALALLLSIAGIAIIIYGMLSLCRAEAVSLYSRHTVKRY